MSIGLSGIQFLGAPEGRESLSVFFLVRQNSAHVQIRYTNIISHLRGPLEEGECFIRGVFLQLNITQIRERLRMAGIDAEFGFKRGFGFVVLVQLPVEIAQTKMDAGFSWRRFRGSLELRYGFHCPA